MGNLILSGTFLPNFKMARCTMKAALQNIKYNDTISTMNDVKILESHIVYFSAGESKIKEVLVKRDPSYSI
jgi:hypothetical protein